MKYILLVLALAGSAYSQCNPTESTCSGPYCRGPCAGQLMFEDNFNKLDMECWQHEITMAGGGNWEFQWYTNNRSNSFTRDGSLFICPTLTEEVMGEAALRSATLNIHGGTPADTCTDPAWWGCERAGGPNSVLNPIRSARLRSVHSFSFRYGRIEVRARLPAGDWIWPAVWLMPKLHAYSTWPASGEIDLMESRGNRQLTAGGTNIGAEQVGQTLHFGPDPTMNGWETCHGSQNRASGFHNDYHTFSMLWTPTNLQFFIDDQLTIQCNGPFWERGQFDQRQPGRENPWLKDNNHYNMAPFDQEFYIIINNAVGGTAYFPDGVSNPGGKPWSNNSPQASTDFWNGRNQWLPTWNMGNDFDRSLKVDYIRVWAL